MNNEEVLPEENHQENDKKIQESTKQNLGKNDKSSSEKDPQENLNPAKNERPLSKKDREKEKKAHDARAKLAQKGNDPDALTMPEIMAILSHDYGIQVRRNTNKRKLVMMLQDQLNK